VSIEQDFETVRDGLRFHKCPNPCADHEDASAALSRIEAERDALKAALTRLLDNGEAPHPLSGRDPTVRWEDVKFARQALEETT
jgi:hypothetical protein